VRAKKEWPQKKRRRRKGLFTNDVPQTTGRRGGNPDRNCVATWGEFASQKERKSRSQGSRRELTHSLDRHGSGRNMTRQRGAQRREHGLGRGAGRCWGKKNS